MHKILKMESYECIAELHPMMLKDMPLIYQWRKYIEMDKEEDIVYKKGVLTHASGTTSCKLLRKVY